MENKGKLLLIDGNSIMNRAFYGVPLLTDKDGNYTNALYGFLNILFKNIDEEKPSHLAVAFDRPEPTFRHKVFEEYKGNRTGMPDELRSQMPLIKDILDAMDLSRLEQAGIEADDIIGTLAKEAEKEGYEVSILTGDRDLLQLATDKIKLIIPTTKAKKPITLYFNEQNVIEEYQVSPQEFVDLKGLMGDKSDNIPGVAGIGIKTATKLIQEYNSIENTYKNLDKLAKGLRKKLEDGEEMAKLSKELASIDVNCKLDKKIEEFLIDDYLNAQAYELFKKYEFHSLLPKFQDTLNSKKDKTSHQELDYQEVTSFSKISQADFRAVYYLSQDDNFTILAYDGEEVLYYESTKGQALASIKNLIKKTDKIYISGLKEFIKYFRLEMDISSEKFLDIMLMHYLVKPNDSKDSLEKVAVQYTPYNLKSKEELLGEKGYMDLGLKERLSYMYLASRVIFEAGSQLVKEIGEMGLLDLYYDIELPLCYVLADMEKEGIKVEADVLKLYEKELKERLKEIEKIIYKYAGEEFNISSPKQLGQILFEKLKLRTIKKTKTGYSTAADVLEELKNEHPIIENILEYRQISKLLSTYLVGLANYIEADGRIHTTFMQSVASTGRLTSIEPNLQNIPIRYELGKKIRKAFVAKEGYSFLDADYSQIELRVLAHLSDDESFIKAYKEGLDIHRLTASQVFDIPFDEVSPTKRQEAKAVNFGIIYGISEFSLSKDLGITVKEAKTYMQYYFERYPNVKKYLDTSIEQAREKGFVRTMFGRIRQVPELKSKNFRQRAFGERIAMNAPIQGSAADIIKIAMINVYKKLKSEKIQGKLILQVHDELILEIKDEDIKRAELILKNEMENAVKLKVPLIVEVETAKNWYDTK